jgi:DNA repair protein SbcD/Mre11
LTLIKFIHSADIHLDSPLKGLEQYEGAPVEQIRGATRRALENLVDLAIREKVHFVLVAGDLYDGAWKDYQTGLFVVKQASRLREAGIGLYLIAGNHDASNKMTRSLPFPDNVKLFSADSPETFILGDLDIAIHGQSFATAEMVRDLAAGYPAPVRGCLNIAMLHTCLDGREGHSSYAPCSLDALRLKGYDYWALGHIHQREILCEEPFIAFSGNSQGRHIRETGSKGCFLVTKRDSAPLTAKFVPLDVMRWEHVVVPLEGATHMDDVLEQTAASIRSAFEPSDGKPLAVRLTLQGSCEVHRTLQANRESWVNHFRSVAIDIAQGNIWIEKIKFLTTPMSQPNVIDESSLGELSEIFQSLRHHPGLIESLDSEFTKIARKLPPELFEEPRNDARWLLSLIDEAESVLMERLLNPHNKAGITGGEK